MSFLHSDCGRCDSDGPYRDTKEPARVAARDVLWRGGMRDGDPDDDNLEWYVIALIAVAALAMGPILVLLAPHVTLVSK